MNFRHIWVVTNKNTAHNYSSIYPNFSLSLLVKCAPQVTWFTYDHELPINAMLHNDNPAHAVWRIFYFIILIFLNLIIFLYLSGSIEHITRSDIEQQSSIRVLKHKGNWIFFKEGKNIFLRREKLIDGEQCLEEGWLTWRLPLAIRIFLSYSVCESCLGRIQIHHQNKWIRTCLGDGVCSIVQPIKMTS